MDVFASVLTNLGFMLYAGPMVAFTALIIVGPLFDLPATVAIRAYRAWGPGLGLALGACILGGLGGIWLESGTFSWSWETSADQLRTVTHGLFFCAWLSNIQLEIWTLDPLRKIDPEQAPDDFRRATGVLGRHMSLQSALLIGVAVMETIRQSY